MPEHILFVEHGISGEGVGIEIFAVHIHGGYAAVVVGCVIKHALVRIEAGGVYGYLVFVLRDLAAAAHLLDRAEYMEELTDALRLAASGERIELGERGSDESRHRG